MSFIADLLNYEFMQRALIVAILTGIISGVIGTLIMLRGLSMLGDAISHSVVPGVAIAYIFQFNFFYGAVITGLLSALGIGFIQQRTKVKQDAAIAIILSAFFAFGIILISRAGSAIDLTKILFGNILAVKTEDMWISLIVGVIVLTVVALLFKELVVSSFDPDTAEVYGFKTKALQYLMLVLLTLVTVASMQTVGVVLVIALLITPAATAYLLVKRVPQIMFLATIIGAFSSLVGMILSFQFNYPSGPVIVLVTALWFVLAMLFAPRQGIVTNFLKRLQKRVSNKKRISNKS